MSHLTFDNRKTISNMVYHKKKRNEVGEAIGCDPTTVSKETERNRLKTKVSIINKDKECPKLKKFPHVCVDCPSKPRCNYDQYRYDAAHAQKMYESRLHNSRKGINLTEEEFARIDTLVKDGLEGKKSIYEIVRINELGVSQQTIYRYIDKSYLSTKKIDLPYAVKYKKGRRKKKSTTTRTTILIEVIVLILIFCLIRNLELTR